MNEKWGSMPPESGHAMSGSVGTDISENAPAQAPAIGEEDIRRAEELLEQYRQGKRSLDARIVDEENEILVFSGGSVTVPERAGYSLSVLALSDRCTGVSIHGTKYELEHVTVENSFPIGVSNQWRGTAEITVEQGVLAVIESKM